MLIIQIARRHLAELIVFERLPIGPPAPIPAPVTAPAALSGPGIVIALDRIVPLQRAVAAPPALPPRGREQRASAIKQAERDIVLAAGERPGEQPPAIIIDLNQFGPAKGERIVAIADQIRRAAAADKVILDDPLAARLDNQHFAAAA